MDIGIAWPPWFGPTGAYNQPDPLIYWLVVPPLAYLWAIFLAGYISLMINWTLDNRPDDDVPDWETF